jgi:acetyl esterase/lipase
MPFDVSKLGTTESDVTYCTMEGVDLAMDVYYPDDMDGEWPAVVYIHGGAWMGGDKTSGAGYRELPELVSRGYLAVSVNYRLAPDYPFPAMIEDVKCAIRHLRAHAREYNLDPERIGAWGSSAGGHLVSLLGVTDREQGYDQAGQYLDQSSRVMAVADLFGPADLTLVTDTPRVREAVFGTADPSAAILETASPVIYVTADDPPFLILHGDRDDVVPPEHSERLYARLTEAGVPVVFVLVENAGHGFSRADGAINPSRDQITGMIADFFDQHLK